MEEPLINRRKFFAKASKKILPILGVVLTGPSMLVGCSKDEDTIGCDGCMGTCGVNCTRACANDCSAQCADNCYESCRYMCGGCASSCTKECNGVCINDCLGCESECTKSCSGTCTNGCDYLCGSTCKSKCVKMVRL